MEAYFQRFGFGTELRENGPLVKRAECARKACKRYYRRYRDKELDRASAFLQPAETCGGPYVEAKDAVADKLEGPLRKAGVIMAKVS